MCFLTESNKSPQGVRKALSRGKGLICVSWSFGAPTDKLRWNRYKKRSIFVEWMESDMESGKLINRLH